jgi:fructokinase
MSVVSLGELLIDFVALESGVSVGEASGFLKAPGGAPANVAVAVSRLGHPAAFLGQVGDDSFGHYLADVLTKENVDVRGLRFSKEAHTALAFVSLKSDGDRDFEFYRNPSADMLMRPEDVEVRVINGKKVFHFGSVTMIVEPSRSATLMAASYAHAHGLVISYDPNLRRSLWPSDEAAREGMLTGLNYAHILKVSDEEVEFLTGGSDVGALWRTETQIIIVTHGAGGATLHTRKEHFHVPGWQVSAVDTTGAGDSFVAAVLTSIIEHGDDYMLHINDILRFANAVGAITTTKRGAIPALPTRAEVDAFMRDPDGDGRPG